jgi:glycosyltransferase involved in cell wall biosynthesis
MPEVEFLLCGDKIDWNNRELVGWIEEAKLRSCFHLLGPREDMPRITAALDVASSSSYSEAWPLAIGEAMACGVPCVVTDVGDSGLIVGDTGRVVSPKDPAALADAWRQVLALGSDARAQLGAAARRRVEEHFSVSTAVAKYEQLYKEEFGSRSDLVATVGNGFGWSRGSRRVEADEFVSAAEGLGRGVDSPVESSVDPPHDRGRTHEGIA